jgi:hypothetical protein
MSDFVFTLMMGIGATALLDFWSLARKQLLAIATPNYRLVGRWFAHMSVGRVRHVSIAASAPIRGELVIGWSAHYIVGVVFAALLTGLWGPTWLQNPSLGPALLVGTGSVAAPFLIMQPGMGAGIAASRTPNPKAARFQSLVTHVIFGLGLYASAWIINWVINS